MKNIREEILLKKGWKFTADEVLSTAYYKGLNDSNWQDIEVPHDWSVTFPFNQSYSSGSGYLKGGVGWYRCHFNLDKDTIGKRVTINFDGVYKNAKVWINTNYLGRRPYGYTSFSYDISEFVCEGENVIAVRAEHEDLADSRWFTGNGIYRDVKLIITDKNYIEDIFIYTKNVDANCATMGVDAVYSESTQINYEVYFKGELAGSDFDGKELFIKEPKLWDIDNPNLYTLKAILKKDGVVCDEKEVVFGIRTFSFDVNNGFELNGKNMKLKGLCMHHDAGVLGAAVPKEVWRNRFEKFKECGCNAIRCSHNPPAANFLDLCDEMGFLVMDEAFDEWEGCKNKWWQGHNVYPPKHYGYYEDFPQWHERDLKDMIIRDRNHPSIIIWSIGNEVDYPNDPYVHPYFETMTGNNDKNKPAAERVYDTNKPNANRLAKISERLVKLCKEVDTTRPITSALAFPELSNLTGYAQTLDIVGYNYKEHLYEEDHANYPKHVIYGSENSTHVSKWLPVKNNDYICGQFLWTGIDFLGECIGWPYRISQAGLLTMAADEKANFYNRKMIWTDKLSAKIATGTDNSERATQKEEFKWNYKKGEKVFVSVYTNGDSAELLLNGKSLGVKELGESDLCRAVFELEFEEGTLEAICKKGNETVKDELKTAKDMAEIKLTSLTAEGDEVVQIDVSIVDDMQTKIVHNDVLIYYSVEGGVLLGIESGSPCDISAYTNTYRKTYRGNSIVYIKMTSDKVVLSAVCGEIKTELTKYNSTQFK